MNTAADAVRVWTVINSSQREIFSTYSFAAGDVYTAATLYKTIFEDEGGIG